MDEIALVRQDLVERLDAMAHLLEDVATEAVREGQLALATDLWVASARVLGASDELWNPTGRFREVPPTD